MTLKSKPIVLLVEDEASIRLVGSDALINAGYDVVEAASADEAIRILEAADKLDVLFTDIRMPGSMDGLQLATLVHERWPATKILITSGDTWPSKGSIPVDGRFLAKPYPVAALEREVDDLLGSKVPG